MIGNFLRALKRPALAFGVFSLLLQHSNEAEAGLLYAALSDGAFNGVAIFDDDLGFIDQISVAGVVTGIAAESASTFFVGAGNTVYKYDIAGNLLDSISGSGTTLIKALSFSDSILYAALTDQSFNGVATFDPSLSFIDQIAVAGVVTGVAAETSTNTFFTSAGNTLYKYDIAGNLLDSISGSGTTQIKALSFTDSILYAALTDQAFSGVATFDPSFGFIDQVSVAAPVSAVAAGLGGVFYTAAGNTVYRYDAAGNLLGSISGSGTTRVSALSYFDTTVVAVPEPPMLTLFGFALFALVMFRRPRRLQR